MNTDQMKGNWKQLVGKAKEKWGKLTDDDWKVAEGKRDQLVGRIQERWLMHEGPVALNIVSFVTRLCESARGRELGSCER
jgi:uncharacterized protein YjbJ (UPF0337 family)